MACIHNAPSVINMYRECNVKVVTWPGISDFPHTTGGWYPLYNPIAVMGLFKCMVRFMPSIHATEALIRDVQPDLVHLNSLVLAPSAVAVKRVGLPLVWHVQESVHPGHIGLRRWLLRSLMLRLADEAIFIAKDNQIRLTGDLKGVVIPNFIESARFDWNLISEETRIELGIKCSDKIVLFFGCLSRLKGAPVLLEALQIVRKHVHNLHCVFAAAIRPMSNNLFFVAGRKFLPLIGKGTERQTFYKALETSKMQDRIHLLPFRNDPERLIAAADLVVFPATQPHFGRPVIEAGSMAKPVVASKIGGVEESVEEGITGLLVPPNDPDALANAIIKVLQDNELARYLGENGYKRAITHYNAEINIRRIMEVYDHLLKHGEGGEKLAN